MQREMTFLTNEKREPKQVVASIVARCATEQDAFRLCISESRVYRTHSQIAELLGLIKKDGTGDSGRLSRMLNGDKSSQPLYMSRTLQIRLQEVCENTAIDQWAEMYRLGVLNCQRSECDREEELLAELSALRARKTA